MKETGPKIATQRRPSEREATVKSRAGVGLML